MSQPQGQPAGGYSSPPGPQQPGWGAPPPGYGPPPPARRKSKAIPILIAVLVILVVCAGGGIVGARLLFNTAKTAINNGLNSLSQTATAAAGGSSNGGSSTPGSGGGGNGGGGTTPSGFQTYNDGMYQIKYPNGWVAQSDKSGSVVIVGLENGEQFWIWDGKQDYDDTKSFDDILCLSHTQAGATITMVTIDGMQWTREVCTSTQDLADVVESVIYKGNIYALEYIAAPSIFADDQKNIFGPMEQSFQFLI
jgi:hypothetical protein